MATYSKLDDETASKLYHEMGEHISNEAEMMYRQNNCKAGQYCGSWYRFRNAWLEDKVYNLEVYEALKTGYTPAQYI